MNDDIVRIVFDDGKFIWTTRKLAAKMVAEYADKADNLQQEVDFFRKRCWTISKQLEEYDSVQSKPH